MAKAPQRRMSDTFLGSAWVEVWEPHSELQWDFVQLYSESLLRSAIAAFGEGPKRRRGGVGVMNLRTRPGLAVIALDMGQNFFRGDTTTAKVRRTYFVDLARDLDVALRKQWSKEHPEDNPGLSREAVIAWLAADDPNGSYLDVDVLVEGGQPLTYVEALDLAAERLDVSKTQAREMILGVELQNPRVDDGELGELVAVVYSHRDGNNYRHDFELPLPDLTYTGTGRLRVSGGAYGIDIDRGIVG